MRRQQVVETMILLGYQAGRVGLGLLVHPYRTMRALVRSWILLPLSFLPMAILIWLLVLARVAAQLVDVEGFVRTGTGVTLITATIGLLLWQGLLGYLLIRFWMAIRGE